MSNRTTEQAAKIIKKLSRTDLEALEHRQLLASTTVQSLPFRLDFNENVSGTVVDKDGQGTGFTRLQANKYGTEYQQNLIDLNVATGRLAITTTGTSSAGSNAGTDNTQTNALETQFDGTTSGFTVTSRLIGPLGYLNDAYEQAGIYLGPDQDNYVKVVAIKMTDGNYLQFKDEINGVSSLSDTQSKLNIGSFSSINTLDVRLVGDAATGKVAAYYAVNGGAFVKVGFEYTIASSKRAAFFNDNSRAGLITSHKNNVGPITAVFDSFEITAGSAVTQQPQITGTRPDDGQTNVDRNVFIAADLSLPNVGGGVDSSTLNNTTVKLYRQSDGAVVSGSVNTTGGGDAIVFTPSGLLAANTTYVFEVTSGVKDTTGASFLPYKSTFTTGTGGVQSDTSIAFDKAGQTITQGKRFTSLAIGPDHKMYATTIEGQILRYNIAADGSLTNPQSITTITDGEGKKRSMTAIVFDPASTASNLIAYVAHGDFAGIELKEYSGLYTTAAANWSGKITKLSGANLQNRQDIVTGLPRSVKDHQTYQMTFGADGMLYVSQGAQNAMGAPDNAWGQRAEELMSAAILRVNVAQIGTGTINVRTAGVTTPYNPYAAGAPVTIYATGVRSAYDLLWHSNGKLYTGVNGSAAGGNTPAKPGVSGTGLTNVATQNDYLLNIQSGKYYGHPNALRGEYILDGGNPTSGADYAEVLPDATHPAAYPVGTQPDSDYGGYVYNFGFNQSPNGLIEYKGHALNGALNGKIMIVRYSGGDDIMILTVGSNGAITNAQSGYTGLTGLVNPLDLVEDPTTGFVYVAEFGDQGSIPGSDAKITLLKPASNAPASVPGAASLSRNKVYFSDQTNTSASSKPQTVRITNTGSGALTINGVSFSGTNAGEFKVTDAFGNAINGPLTIAAGARMDLYVTFKATTTGIRTATMTVDTSDGDQTVALRALGLAGSGGSLEPSLQRILDLYQIGINVGDPDPSTTDFPPDTATSVDEVTMPRLVKAGSGPVTVEILGTFANQVSNTTFGWYEAGNFQTKNSVATVNVADNQSIAPLADGQFTFEPGTGAFGIYSNFTLGSTSNPLNRDVFSENVLNTWETNTSRQKKVRFYKMRDTSGNVVPNTYVFAFEEYNVTFDQNDIVGIIRNVAPAASAPELGLENRDGAPFANRLVMSRIRNGNTDFPNEFHDTTTLRIRNTGDKPLDISSITLSNSDFQIVSGGGARTLAANDANAFVDVVVKFVYNNTTALGNSLRNGTLTINSNDPDEPAKAVALAGIWQSYSENQPNGVSAEPVPQTVINALGYKVNLTTGTQKIDTKGVATAVGEEVLSELWQRADTGLPVTARMLATYHQQYNVDYSTKSTLYWYNPNVINPNSSKPTLTKLVAHNQADSQSLLPRLDGSTTAPAQATFNPGSVTQFGFNIDGNNGTFSQDQYNTPNDANNPGHGWRFYAAKDANGKIIPNTYLALQDYVKVSYANYDYQDNIILLTNVRPVNGPVKAATPTATAQAGGIALNWADNTEGNVTGYNVYRATSANGPYSLITETPTPSSDYLDTEAPLGVTSYYQVTAVNQHGAESATKSGTASATRTTSGSVPKTPTNVLATANSSTTVSVTWTDASTDELGFRIERRIGSGAWGQVGTASSNATSFSDTTASAGTTYTYRVFAYNGAGSSVSSNESTTTTPNVAATAPAAPTDVAATANSGTSVSVTWTDASNNETSFRVERKEAGSPYAAVGTTLANAVTYTDTTATAGVGYRYRVVAVNSTGETVSTNEASVVTPTPLALQSADIGNPTPAGSINTITSQKDYDVTVGGLDIWDTYDSFNFLYQQRTGDFDVAVQVTDLTNIDPSTQAGLMVRESTGTGSRNIMLKARPSGLRLTYRDTTNDTTTATGSGNASFPDVYLRMQRVGDTFNMFTSTDGSNWTPYYSMSMGLGDTVLVGMATSAKSNSQATTAKYRGYGDTVAATPTLDAPTGLNAVAQSPTSVLLTWNDNASTETGYRVDRRIGSGAWQSIANLNANTETYTDTGASANTTYTYRVVATTATDAALSNEKTVTTPGGTTNNGTLTATDDGFVRGGTDAGKIFGGSTIEVKYSTSTSYYRNGYVKFDISSLAGQTLSQIKLRLFGGTSQTNATVIPVTVTGAASNWSESTLTYNTRPATTGGTLGTMNLVQGQQWYEVDVTNFVKAALANGQTSVSFALAGTTSADPFAKFNTHESGANGPQLAITGGGSTPTATAPNAASGAAATANSSTSVNVTWNDNSSDETGFRIQRRIGSGAWQTVGTANANAESYTDNTAAANTSYGYRVIAYNSLDAGASNEALVTTPGNGSTATTTTLNATGDAFVQNGGSAGTNYGSATALQVKNSTSAGYLRQAYLKFDISSLSSASSVKLRLFANINTGSPIQLAAYGVSNTTWNESTLTYNNKPATGSALGTASVGTTTAQWIEIDITAYVQQAIAANQSTVSIGLQATAASTGFVSIASRETGNGPQMVVVS